MEAPRFSLKVWEHVAAERAKDLEREMTQKLALDNSIGPYITGAAAVFGSFFYVTNQTEFYVNSSVEKWALLISIVIFSFNAILLMISAVRVYIIHTVYRALGSPKEWDNYMRESVEFVSASSFGPISPEGTAALETYLSKRSEQMSDAIASCAEVNRKRGDARFWLMTHLTIAAAHVLAMFLVLLLNQVAWGS